MYGIAFEWDRRKNSANQRKHGVSFELAARMFLDTNRIEQHDDRADYGEDRWITIGMVVAVLLAVVQWIPEVDRPNPVFYLKYNGP